MQKKAKNEGWRQRSRILKLVLLAGCFPLLPGSLVLLPQGHFEPPSGRIQPEDMEYLGAFRLPDGLTGSILKSWNYGGHALTYYPEGDPNGPDDGFPGSLFGTGHAWRHEISEISIPVPVVSKTKNPSDLNRAVTLQPFQDILDVSDLEIPRSGLAFLPKQGPQNSDKLHFCWGAHFQENGDLAQGWCDLNLTDPKVRRGWRLKGQRLYSTNDYLFTIPKNWADAHTPNMRLAGGRFRDGGWSGQGPSLFAYGPWNEGNPPANGASLSHIPLLLYTSSEDFGSVQHTMKDYHHSDEWSGGAWLSSGSKSTVVFAGTKGVGDCWYGDQNGPCLDCAGDRGWWSTEFRGQLIFYDTDDLAEVAAARRAPYEPQPYASLNIDPYLFNIKSNQQKYHVNAICFDRKRGYLFVYECRADGEKGLIHVWKIKPQAPPVKHHIAIISPNGGDVWPVGSTQKIIWSSSGAIGNVRIAYSTVRNRIWSIITSSVPDTGMFEWHIPDISSAWYLIKISAVSKDVSDTSDSAFFILNYPRMITISPKQKR